MLAQYCYWHEIGQHTVTVGDFYVGYIAILLERKHLVYRKRRKEIAACLVFRINVEGLIPL